MCTEPAKVLEENKDIPSSLVIPEAMLTASAAPQSNCASLTALSACVGAEPVLTSEEGHGAIGSLLLFFRLPGKAEVSAEQDGGGRVAVCSAVPGGVRTREAEPGEGAVGRHVAGAAARRVDGGVVSREPVARAEGEGTWDVSAASSEAVWNRAVLFGDGVVLSPAMPLGVPPARTCSPSGRSLLSGARTWK